MLTYLCETHFWTTDDDITIKHTDLGAFKYESKKTSPVSVYVEGKRRWVEGRGGAWRGGGALKGRLRELGELLRTQRTLLCRWVGASTLLLLFSSGTLAYVLLEPASAHISRILYDRYLVGKLLSSNISEVLLTDTHILLTYNDNQAILVSFNRPSIKSALPQKLSNRDPKLQTVDLGVGGGVWGGRGSPGVSGSCGGNSALLWSRASPSDLFPWSPHSDHANVHIYTLSGSQMSLLCYHRIEFDPLCVSFSTLHDDIIFSVEQKSSKKGGVVVEWRRLRAGRGGCVAAGEAVRLAAPAPATCSARSPCEGRLLLACSDRSILLHHAAINLTTTITASFVRHSLARTCSWWSGGVVVGGTGAQLQAWDAALGPARLAPPGDHAPPDTLLDLTSYFKKEPALTQLVWNRHSGSAGSPGGTRFLAGDGLLLLLLRGGPLVCLRLYTAATALERPVVVRRGQEARALAQLRGADWGSQGATCLALLHQLINTLFSAPLSVEREQVAQAALGTFLAPPTPLAPAVRLHHLPHLQDLCRRFFHLLIRYGRLEKALCLAIDVGHADLFMDVHYAARATGQQQLAQEALQHAHDAASSCASSCSRLSCSRCSSSSGSASEGEGPPAPRPLDLYGSSSPRAPRRPPPPLPQLPAPSTLQLFQADLVENERSLRLDWPRLNLPSLKPDALLHMYSPVYPSAGTRGLSLAPHSSREPPTMRSIREELPTSPPGIYRPDLTATQPPPPFTGRLDYLPAASGSRSDLLSALSVSRYRKEFSGSRGDLVGSSGSTLAESNTPTKTPGEKNKVKFSDTVTVAVVPEIPRKERRPVHSRGAATPDPRRELADSLPLCHPNHDYLKDFTPHPENEEQEKASKIKVVHFGVV